MQVGARCLWGWVGLTLLGEAVVTHEGVGGGTVTAEALIKYHGVVAAAHLEDVCAEGVGSGGIEDAILLEHLKGIGVEHLGPQVGVVARCILVAAEDVLEVGAVIAVLDLDGHAECLANLCLEGVDVDGVAGRGVEVAILEVEP